MLSSGICGGGGHGGKGGDGVYKGDLADGGPTYGNADLPCELGSGSGNDSTELSTAGGGIIGSTYAPVVLIFFLAHSMSQYCLFNFFVTALQSWAHGSILCQVLPSMVQ